MFLNKKNDMRPGPTPERVLAICRIVGKNIFTQEEIEERAYLSDADAKGEEEFTKSLKVASEELGLLSRSDGKFKLSVSPDVIESVENFRYEVAKRVFNMSNSRFFQVSKWYISKNDTVLSMGNWESKAVAATGDGIENVTENDMLGWRFWASFLGLGYLSDTELIPNMYIRLRDILSNDFGKDFSYGDSIPANTFFDWLFSKAPEAKCEDTAPLNLALSNGLRTLRDLGYIELVSGRDAIRRGMFIISEDKNNEISHVVVKEAIRQ